MIETFTSIDNLNYPRREQENTENVEGVDAVFYENIKSQLNMLKRNPSDESLAKILAYSKAK